MLTIREEEDVRAEVDAALVRWSRADDAWEAITWAIARDPTVGLPHSESGKLRSLTIDGARSIDEPTITVVYEIGETTITIIAALFEDAPYAQAGHA